MSSDINNFKEQFETLSRHLSDFLLADWKCFTNHIAKPVALQVTTEQKRATYQDDSTKKKMDLCDDLTDKLEKAFKAAGHSDEEWQGALLVYALRPADKTFTEEVGFSQDTDGQLWPQNNKLN